jgi:hypothetical protein
MEEKEVSKIRQDELLGSVMQVMIDRGLVPASVPFIGNLTDTVVEWSGEHPVEAEQIINEVFDLMKQYKGRS